MTGIELGHALITMIEPDPETILEYHRWYEQDHFLAGVLVGPGAFAGQRWVATRDLKALRRPADSPVAQPVDDGSFITLYWIEQDKLSDHTDWGFPEAARFAAEGRMDPRRHHVSTSYYDLVAVVARDEESAPAELAIHRQYPGLVVVWADVRSTRPVGRRSGRPGRHLPQHPPARAAAGHAGHGDVRPGPRVEVHPASSTTPRVADPSASTPR